ncbi:glycosyltransferase family 4 protein [Agrobacterium sp. Azo12]|uniref:glycosyltransferase family 4 protein n=1 Tax=Agrobacterium sp. Azo12 TaxID=3031129 RepID=UPI0023D7BF88|nr:glycosyltransferase family 4 protein [Agrobacterium sp. Azo12]MDO5896975.1 glycosyltransferase family 4 protein [Agrobacterium sp. Azo12]
MSLVLSNPGSIWIIHPYAGGPGVGRYDRPYHLAKCWQERGEKCVVITCSDHHLLDQRCHPGPTVIQGVLYEFLKSFEYQGNGVRRLLNMAAFTAAIILRSGSLARRYGRPSRIIISSPHPYAYLAGEYLRKRFSAKLIFEVRDLWPLSLVELAGVSPSHPLVRFTDWLERRAYRTADQVVSLLPCTKPHMLERGLSEKRWHYIPNGILNLDSENSIVDNAAIRLVRQWREEGKFVLAYTGALGRPNHVQSLIAALAIQARKDSNVYAVIVGRGDLKADIISLIENRNLAHRVAVFDQIPKKEVICLLNDVDAGFISLRPEPIFRFGISPNKLFDYMLLELPVVFAVTSGNDPVSEAGCGSTADPRDPEDISRAIDSLANLSIEERQKLGARGKDWVIRNHSYDVLAENYIKLMGVK